MSPTTARRGPSTARKPLARASRWCSGIGNEGRLQAAAAPFGHPLTAEAPG